MALPEFTIRQLLEAGIHFGHRKHLWNPKMSRYIYGTRKNIHIIDLSQTAPLLYEALQAISETVAKGGRVLMVGTKRQAQESIADAAKQSAQYFVNARWLGGMLTNWKTVSQAIQRLSNLDVVLGGDTTGRTKKEILNLTRERDKLERNLGGIRDMGGVPDMLFVIDTNKEAIAIQEAKRLEIPVVAVLDSNSNPDGITYPIPGNDDASRSITLYCDLVSQAAIDGLSRAENRLDDYSEKFGDAGENEKSAKAKGKSRKTDSDKDEKAKDSGKPEAVPHKIIWHLLKGIGNQQMPSQGSSEEMRKWIDIVEKEQKLDASNINSSQSFSGFLEVLRNLLDGVENQKEPAENSIEELRKWVAIVEKAQELEISDEMNLESDSESFQKIKDFLESAESQQEPAEGSVEEMRRWISIVENAQKLETSGSKKVGKKTRTRKRSSAKKSSNAEAKKSGVADKKSEDKAKDAQKSKADGTSDKKSSDTGKKEKTDKKPSDAKKPSTSKKQDTEKKSAATKKSDDDKKSSDTTKTVSAESSATDKKTDTSKSESSKSDDKSE